MAELCMYQRDIRYIFPSYHSKWNIPWSFLFNVLNLSFITTTKKTISVAIQIKVKKITSEKYLLNRSSRNWKEAKKEEEGNGQKI